MTGVVRRLERRYRLARVRIRGGSDYGFSLIELIVTLFVLGIVMALSGTLMAGFGQSSTNISNTTVGVSQAELAQQTLVQYLRGISQILPLYNGTTQIGPSETELDGIVSEGFSTTGPSKYTSGCTNLDALWEAPSPGSGDPSPDARFIVSFDVPAKGPANGMSTPPAPWDEVTPSSDIPTAFTPVSTCAPKSSTSRTVASYYALRDQTAPVFTYYEFSPTGLVQIASDNPVAATDVSQIAAIGIHVTFLAGPQQPHGAFAGVQSTTLDTIVYLHSEETAS